MHIIHIRGAHSLPSQVDLMTHAAQQTQQHSHRPAEILRQNSKLPPWLARHYPFGEGHEQARSVLGPEQVTEQGQLAWYATEDLQQNLEHSQLKEKSAESWHNTWTHQASQADSDKHIMYTAPPTPLHSRHDSDNMQNSLNEKYKHTELAPWLARHHLFGEGYRHTGTVLRPVQGSGHGLQILANKELQRQIPHLTRESEVRPRHQTRTPQKKADIQSRPMCTTHLAPRYHPMGGSYAKTPQKGNDSEIESKNGQDAELAADTRPETTEQPQGWLLAQGCGRIAEFLAQVPWNEKREGLSATQSELEKHLYSHNSTCHHLPLMLEELPTEAIPTADSKILQQIHRTLQNSMMPGWPVEWFQPETSTPGFDVVISKIAEFETLRLGFLITIKETLLGVYDTHMTEMANQPPQLTHLLDMKPALTWVKFILPEELILSPLQSATLQETFGPLGKIAEIFLFKPRPDGFIIFHGSLKIPNIDEILSPQHSLIMIKNPNHSLFPIRSAAAPHYPPRRQALDTLVTLTLRGRDRHEATVVAIEQNY